MNTLRVKQSVAINVESLKQQTAMKVQVKVGLWAGFKKSTFTTKNNQKSLPELIVP